MKIKTFYGSTMRDALDLVKRELGPNALILSSKQVKARPALGLKKAMAYEITAALDSEAESAESNALTLSAPADDHAASPAVGPPGRRPQTDSARRIRTSEEPAQDIDPALRNELNQLRRLIYALTKPSVMRRMPVSDSASYEIFCELLANDIDETLACQLIDGAKTHLAGQTRATKRHWTEAIRQRISDMISVAPIEEGRRSTGADSDRIVAAFIGPTGVGKTTTIAKLAARYALEQRRNVLLVTLDTYRIAAIEQLRTYAGIIGVPVEVISDVAGLDRVLTQNAKKTVILIDTTGCSPREAARMQSLACYLESTPTIQKHLVLSATTKSIDLAEIVEKFSIFGPTNLLFTKLDETSTFGPMLNELVRTRKPLSYLTNGQRVPEDLSIPTARDVASLLVPAAMQ